MFTIEWFVVGFSFSGWVATNKRYGMTGFGVITEGFE